MKRTIFIIFITLSTLGLSQAQINKPYFYQRGQELNMAGRYREAIEALNILLRTQTDDYEGYFLRGVSKYNLEDLNGAFSDFTAAIGINENYTRAYQYRAITNSRMGQYEAALSDFEKALSIRPGLAGLYYSRGITYFLNQQFEKAITDFNQYLRFEPKDPSGYINRGSSYLYMKDTTSAISNYNRAIEVNPYHADGYMRRGLISIMQGKYLEALPYLDKTIEIAPDAAFAYFYRAMTFTNLDKIMMALDDFDTSIALDSTNSITYYNRALLRSQIGDYNRAIDDYSKVAKNNPNNVLVFFNRANVYSQIGDYNAAIADYSRAIDLYPDFANAYLFRASLRHILGDLKGSQADTRVAQAKIAEYRSKLNDSTFSAYADTSKRFNQIMSLDADFGNDDFARNAGDTKQEVRLLPMFKFTIADNRLPKKDNPFVYRNRRVEAFIASMGDVSLELTNRENTLSTDTIRQIEVKIGDTLNTWDKIFSKGITQSMLSQFNSAIEYFNFVINERPEEAFAYVNRGVTKATMIDFIASLDGDYQNITIDNDPATRLKRAEKRVYDYSSAINDLEQAAKLMPELPHIYYNMGNLMCQSGDMPAALNYYTKAIELDPYFAEAYYNRGIIQIHLRDSKTGCMDMSKAGELGLEKAYEMVRKYCIK